MENENPVITESQKKEIRQKVEKMAEMLESSTGVSNIFAKKYQEAQNMLRRLQEEKEEKQKEIGKLNSEKQELEQKLSSVQGGDFSAATEAEAADLKGKLENIDKEKERLSKELSDLEKKLKQADRNSSEKHDILNSLKSNFLSLLDILRDLKVPAGRFQSLAGKYQLDLLKRMKSAPDSFGQENRKLADEINKIFAEIKNAGFLDRNAPKEKFEPFYAPDIAREEEDEAWETEKGNFPPKTSVPEPETAPGDQQTENKKSAVNGEKPDQENREYTRYGGKTASEPGAGSSNSGTERNAHRASGFDYSFGSETGGYFRDKIYTLIEKIENSRVDIHSQAVSPGIPGIMIPAEAGIISAPQAAGRTMAYTQPAVMPAAIPGEAPGGPVKTAATEKKTEKTDEPGSTEKPVIEKTDNDKKTSEEKKEEKSAEKKKEDDKKEESREKKVFNPYKEFDEFDEEWGYEEKKDAPQPPAAAEKKSAPEKKAPPQPAATDRQRIDIRLKDDDSEIYGTRLVLTYLFDNMPENLSYSKFKPALRNACRITLLGNLEEGLNQFNMLKAQPLPLEYKEMIDKNIRDVKYFLRGKYRSPDAGEGVVD